MSFLKVNNSWSSAFVQGLYQAGAPTLTCGMTILVRVVAVVDSDGAEVPGGGPCVGAEVVVGAPGAAMEAV